MQPQQYSNERGLLGKLCPGEKKLEGMTFYLDNVKKRPTVLLLEAISLLGGRVESFLHKDVSFVVTGSQEGLKEEKCVVTKGGAKGTSEEAKHSIKQKESGLSIDKPRQGTPRPVACGSRGKALLEKAIRNNERLHGNSVLSNARSWGVKILYVDDVLLYLKQLSRESFSARHRRPEKTNSKQSLPAVKAAALRSPYLKIEDLSRKYKPLHMQSMTFPSLCYLGRFSPFESPPPPRFEKRAEQGESKPREKKVESSTQDKSQTPLSCNPSPWRPRKKDVSYCECCHQPFTNLEEHLQSDQHHTFALDPSNYSVVDQLVTEMFPGFDPNPSQESEETLNRPPTPLPVHDVLELEPLTDVETEHAVQALQRQESSFNTHISSPTRGPFSFGPASLSPGVQLTIPDPATLPADIQSFNPETDCQFPDIQLSSPAMPVLHIEPQTQDSLNLQLESQHLSPCHSASSRFPDPYSLPPVLSPQVHYSSYVMDTENPYSEPPVLSPQQYTTEETVEGQTCEMNTAESVSKFVSAVTDPLSSPLLISVPVTNAEGVKESNQERLVDFSGLACCIQGLKQTTLSSCRSRSLTRQSSVGPNPKKCCQSASPEHSCRKRRRTETFGGGSGCTAHRLKSAKSQSDNVTKTKDYLLFDKTSYQTVQSCPNLNASSTLNTCTVDMLGSKQTHTTFCFPTAQRFTPAPNQIDSVVDQSLNLLSSKAKVSDPPQHFPNDKSHRAFSSQDSQCSLSHSTSVCIESALIPDLATLCPSSSDSDWDCDLLSRLGLTSGTPPTPSEQNTELDKELLQKSCPWMHDTSYESHLHTVLQPSTPVASLRREEKEPSTFSRTVVQIVEVQH
ncbi:uncharacterized protein dbf4b isoform X2 [Acanthochromis polyacanthus]|uniref:uncharacterized protein dbf4b isoform X2 n=1 Tax=Acanthochromis polyacanthus TaxID=80966 RepID=UPI002233EE01|nr:uncharacterized protein dbf4b isoform X2 [Acanthochromis polyacanthus]